MYGRADYASFSINYRLAPQHKYPAQIDGVESAIRFVRQHAEAYKVNPERIALIGESAGGRLVSMVGARNKPDARVNAVVSFYGPHDLERRAVESKEISDQSPEMCEKLKAAGNDCELFTVEGGAHGIASWEKVPGAADLQAHDD